MKLALLILWTSLIFGLLMIAKYCISGIALENNLGPFTTNCALWYAAIALMLYWLKGIIKIHQD